MLWWILWTKTITLIIITVHVPVPATLYCPLERERGCLPRIVQHRVNAVRSHYLLTISSSLRLCASGPITNNNNDSLHFRHLQSNIIYSKT